MSVYFNYMQLNLLRNRNIFLATIQMRCQSYNRFWIRAWLTPLIEVGIYRRWPDTIIDLVAQNLKNYRFPHIAAVICFFVLLKE